MRGGSRDRTMLPATAPGAGICRGQSVTELSEGAPRLHSTAAGFGHQISNTLKPLQNRLKAPQCFLDHVTQARS